MLGHLLLTNRQIVLSSQACAFLCSPHDLRHRFGYRMTETVPLQRLVQIMGHNSLDTTMVYVRGTSEDVQKDVEQIAWQLSLKRIKGKG